MNPDQLFAHFKRLTSTLSTTQLASLAAVFVAVVGVLVGSAYYINTPTYAVLFSDMDSESASAVVTKLKAAKVEYVLDEGGRTVRVPNGRVDELRLDFSSQGMPSSGRIGFEIFDRTAFGTTEFLEHVNYRRALEGELARTIATISEVQSARVHIAMAKDSLFAADTQQAKASVVLKLRGKKPLAAQTIAGITGLVASSVEELRPESVVVLDTFGRSLTTRNEDANLDPGLNLDKQQRLERDLTTKLVAMIEPVVGEGRVRVNVAARLNASSSEETEETWQSDAIVRTKQTSSDIGASPSGGTVGGAVPNTAPGIAGARANTPPAAAAPTATITSAPSGSPAQRTTESAAYEIPHRIVHTISPSGQVARLSVSVLVDDDRTTEPAKDGQPGTPAARSAEQMKKIRDVAASAVGFDEDRGDQLTVENISFDDNLAAVPEAPKTMIERVTTVVESDQVQGLGRTLGVILLAVLAFFLFLKPVMNRALAPAGQTIALPSVPPLPGIGGGAVAMTLPGGVRGAPHPTIAELEQQAEAPTEQRKLPALTRNMSSLADKEPESVARLVRSWIADNE